MKAYPMIIYTLYTICLAMPVAAVEHHLLYDDAINRSFSQTFLITESTEQAFQGGKSLMIQTNPWQTPFMRIASGRLDFRPFDVLEFHIRTDDTSIQPQIIAYDYADSNSITIANYSQGGLIDATWRKVSIPLSKMINPRFAMESVFLLRFSQTPTRQTFYIDNIILHSTTPPVLKYTATRSSRSITLAFEDASIPLTEAGHYSIQSSDDMRYQSPQSIERFGLDRQAIGTPDPGPGRNPISSIKETRLHLLLPFPMREGKHYQVNYHDVRRDNGIRSTTASIILVYDPKRVNGSVQVNQVGYMPAAPKCALVGNWLGTAGAMPIDHDIFHVVEAANKKIRFTGRLTPRAVPDEQSGNNVYLADFSALSATGRYYIEVPGTGRSYTFDIQPDVFEHVYRTTMRVLYHKRNSALISPYVDAGRARSGGIPAQYDAIFHPELSSYPLHNKEQAKQFKAIAPGWFDAGDLGQYITNQAPIWSAISTALDLAAIGSFKDNELNIPESGNGIPDILDELAWGSRWALSMQDTLDGGVYWRVCSASWDYLPPYQIKRARYIYEKTTAATAQFSAMMAIYARLISPYHPKTAAQAQKAAIHAWGYMQNHKVWPSEGTAYHNPSKASGCGEYPVASPKSAQLWAAAELYRLTGGNKYQVAYASILSSMPNPQVANMYPSEVTDAGWAMLMSDHANRDPYLTHVGRKWVMVAADSMLKRMHAHPFYSTKHPAIVFTGWHNFAASAISATKLFQAYYITHDKKYRDAAWTTPNIELGTNPQNRSYLVGIGYNPPLHPLDTSVFDAKAQRIRGGLVPGPTYHLPGYRQPYIDVNQAYYPPESTGIAEPWKSNNWFAAYPVLRRFTDSHALIPMAESTVKEETWNAVAFALMRDENLAVQTALQAYPWQFKQGYRDLIFSDIPLNDVPMLSPERIVAFASSINHAPKAWRSALTPAQMAALP